MAIDESDIFKSECSAGDNVAARKTVRRLIENIDAKGVDVGPLTLSHPIYGTSGDAAGTVAL
jgi:predicted dinucleotide-binding enzyme